MSDTKIYDQVQHLWIFKFYLKVSIKDCLSDGGTEGRAGHLLIVKSMIQILATAAQNHSHQNRIRLYKGLSLCE